MLYFSHGRLFEEKERVHQHSPDQTAANSLITVGTFMSAIFYFRAAIRDEPETTSSLTTKTCLACALLLAINSYRLFHRREYIEPTLPKSLLIALLFIGEQFLFLYLPLLHHFKISRFAFVASLDSRDRVKWILTSLVFLQLVPLRAAILWPLPLSWSSKNVSRRPIRRLLLRVCQTAFFASFAIPILSWFFFLLCPISILVRILQLPQRQTSIGLGSLSGDVLPPMFFIYRLGVFLLSFMDRRFVQVPSFRLRQRLRIIRSKLEVKRTRKVGLVRKFIHIARSGVTILQYYVDELEKAILGLDDQFLEDQRALVALRSLRVSNEEYQCIIDRLSAEFESDLIRRSESSLLFEESLHRSRSNSTSFITQISAMPKLRLILAEDDSVIQIILFRILQPHCKSVTIVNNGLELVRTIVREKRKIQTSPSEYCIITDINMPIVDGKVAVSMIRTLPFAAELPVIALTGTAITEENWLEKYGFNEVIQKPFNPLTLYHEICDVWSQFNFNLTNLGGSDDANPTENSSCDDELEISQEEIIQLSQSSMDRQFHKRTQRRSSIGIAVCLLPVLVTIGVSRSLVPGIAIIGMILGFLNQACRSVLGTAILQMAPGVIANIFQYLTCLSLGLGIDGFQVGTLMILAIYSAFLRISDPFHGWQSDIVAMICIFVTFHSYFVMESVRFMNNTPIGRCATTCATLGIASLGMPSLVLFVDDEKERNVMVKCNREIDAASRTVFEMTETSVTHNLGDHFETFRWALQTLSSLPLEVEPATALRILHQTHSKVSRASRSLTKYCRFEKRRFHLVENCRIVLRQLVSEECIQETMMNEHDVEIVFVNQISDSIVVVSDLSCLMTILSTLIHNAATHGKSDRELMIRTTATETTDGQFFIFRFAVRDFGCGMNEEEIRLTLQDPFSVDVEVSDPTLNRGISLYLSSVVAREMCGSIELTKPTDGEGGLIASFACRFKRNEINHRMFPTERMTQETVSILIIDDCFAVREMLIYHLTQLKGIIEHNITQLSDQNEVFEFFQSSSNGDHGDDFTITFLDNHLVEGSTGLDLALQAKQEGWLSRLGVVCLMSGVGVDLRSLEDEEELSGHEIRSLMKPISPFELREVMKLTQIGESREFDD